MYFGDHIEENLFRTADGHLHETLAAAQDHRRRSFAGLRRDHAAARSDPTIVAAASDAEGSASNDDLARIVAKAVARIVVKDWEGVGDEDGKPLTLTPDGIDALLELWPIFEAFQTKYIAGALILDAEKNA